MYEVPELKNVMEYMLQISSFSEFQHISNSVLPLRLKVILSDY